MERPIDLRFDATTPAPAVPDPADVAALKAQVEEAQQANDDALAALAKRGIQINGAPPFVLGTRLEALAEYLLGDVDDPRRLNYELAVHRAFADQIANANAQADQVIQEARAQAARQALLDGVNLPTPNVNGNGRR